jgi:hypothetical protein
MKYPLTPKTEGISASATISRLQLDAAQGGRRRALGEFALEFQGIPTLLALDILDGTVPLEVSPTTGDTAVIWEGPVGQPVEYLYDWKTLALVVNGLKLEWLQAMLSTVKGIHTRTMPQERRPGVPRLEVPIESYNEATKIYLARICGKLVRELANDDPIFAEGGDAWALDNIDEAGQKHADPEQVKRELDEKPVELPDADE